MNEVYEGDVNDDSTYTVQLTKAEQERDEPIQVIIKRSSRDRTMPRRLEDYEVQLPPNNITPSTSPNSNSFNVKALEETKRYSRAYLCSLNNVLQTKEPQSYQEVATDSG